MISVPGLVDQLGEGELAGRRVPGQPRRRAAAEPAHRPAGQRPGELGDVGLRVAGADAERMQLEDFAREVLVEAALLAAARGDELAGARIRADRLRLVEVDEHRRMLLDRDQHVGEFAQHMRADRLELE